MTIRLRSYRDNPVVFVRLPRADWLIVQRMVITRGARRSDVIREAVANAVAAVDPSLLVPRTPIYPLRQPLSISRPKLNAEILPIRSVPSAKTKRADCPFPW